MEYRKDRVQMLTDFEMLSRAVCCAGLLLAEHSKLIFLKTPADHKGGEKSILEFEVSTVTLEFIYLCSVGSISSYC